MASDATRSPLTGGPNLTRGSIFIPEQDVDPAAYAPYARAVALLGYLAVIVDSRCASCVRYIVKDLKRMIYLQGTFDLGIGYINKEANMANLTFEGGFCGA